MSEVVEEKIKRRGEMKHENTKRRNRRIADGENRIKPKKHEGYWFIDVYGSLCFTQFSSLITFNALNRAIGNCFRTKELAEAHKEEILKILKGEDDEII